MAWRFSVLFLLILGGSSEIQGIQKRSSTTADNDCFGTHNGLSFSGSLMTHYLRLWNRYTGCTHVNGNLEITHLSDPSINYDLSFLRDIRYVSGYVLIALVTQVPEIPLHSLEIIRGNDTIHAINPDAEYSLAVVLTYPKDNMTTGLKELQLPSLQEITNGRVLFEGNPVLDFVDTIDWDVIVRHRPNAVDIPSNVTAGLSMDVSSESTECPSGHMWGRSFCQADNALDIPCHSSCDGRCFGSGSSECCHATCAVGCYGPTNQDCRLCKDYEYNSGCVGFCPARSHPDGQTCVPH